jgi:hypothetical protein
MKVLPLQLLDRRINADLRKKGYRTFDSWQHQGRVVVFGEKSERRDANGRPLFHLSQTIPIPDPDTSDEGWDGEDDLFDGNPWSLT